MAPKILLLTTIPPNQINAAWPYYQNWTLPQALRTRGASVSLRCWRDPSLTSTELASYDTITFLWCNNYHLHPTEFPAFLRERLLPAQTLHPNLRVANDGKVILWNTDKSYLTSLSAAGFLVPETCAIADVKAFTSAESLGARIALLARQLPKGPVILKPSVSGSSKQTYLVRDAEHPTQGDLAFLIEILQNGVDGALLVQEFEPAIASGEYSFVFVAGKHTHTMLKTPAVGEFRCQAEFGGGCCEVGMNAVPEVAKAAAEKLVRWVGENMGAVTYCRVDGVVRETGEFCLMEVEAIEPHLWLETCGDERTREALYRALLGPGSNSLGVYSWFWQSAGSLVEMAARWLSVFRGFFMPKTKIVKL